MKQDVLVDQGYWDTGYKDLVPYMAPPDDPVRQWIEEHMAPCSGAGDALEVGCFPGRYLAVLGNIGYTIHGVDLTPNVANMPSAFQRMGLRTGDFLRVDFLQHDFQRTYDVVCSFGFIEHFTDWKPVLLRHAHLVAPGGALLIETPNFSGAVQRFFHRWLDAENYARHNPEAMDPRAWAALLRASGFEVTHAGWFGSFTFWHDTKGGGIGRRIGFLLLRLITPLLVRMGARSRSLSPYCGIVARKP